MGKFTKPRTAMLLAVVASLTILVAGCGTSTNSGTSSGNATTQTTTASGNRIDFGPFASQQVKDALKLGAPADSIKGKVGFVDDATSFSYGAADMNGTIAAAKAYFPNMQLIVENGQNDPTIESNDVANLVAQGVKVIIISAVTQDALAPAVKKAEQDGVKIIDVDREVSAPVLTTIKAEDYTVGYDCGLYLDKLLNGKGNVVEIEGTPGASPTIDRDKGFRAALAKDPGIKIIDVGNGNYDESTALTVMQDILQRYPNNGQINVVYSEADMMTAGVVHAIQAAGRLNQIQVVSTDGENSGMQLVANGQVAADAVYPEVYPEDVIAAAKALAGEPMPQFIQLESPVVTKQNVSEYLGKNFP